MTAFIRPIGSGPTSAEPPAASTRRTRATAPVAAVDTDLGLVLGQAVEGVGEGLRPGDVGNSAERRAGLVRHLGGIEEHGRAAALGDDRVAERQGRMGDVAAADVERPGEVVGIGDDKGADLVLAELLADARQLVLAALAGKLDRVRAHGSARRKRAIDPDHVDGIHVDRHGRAAGIRGGLFQFLDGGGRVQPRVVAEAGALGQIGLDPGLDVGLGERHRRDDGRVDLFRRLQGIAPVDDEGGRLEEDHGGAGRAGEAGQPGEALGVLRHVFRLMLVGARHDKALEAAPGQLGAQLGNSGGALRRVAALVKALEAAAHGAASLPAD